MKREGTRKVPERRKKRRSDSSAKSSKTAQNASKRPQDAVSAKPQEDSCATCGKDLKGSERALFVEEEVGRFFCSEDCIAAFFAPEIEKLEKEYFRKLPSNDLSAAERESLSHLRWITLQEPDEVWREKTLSGDFRYTMISEFQPGNRHVWCVCICLFLRGEPSFLYLAFPTSHLAFVERYRKGERVQWVKPAQNSSTEGSTEHTPPKAMMDGLAEPWTEDETLRAQLGQERRIDDIPSQEFSLYETCMNETLEAPDEVWSLEVGTQDGPSRMYHFIRQYPDESPGVWYVIVARETEDEEQIEILDAFPTKDSALVERYRRGEQEIGPAEVRPTQRIVH